MAFSDSVGKQVVDNVLHASWAAVVVGFLAGVVAWRGFAPWWAGFVAGVLIDLPREFVDQRVWEKLGVSDWWVDLLCFGAGGAIMALAVEAITRGHVSPY